METSIDLNVRAQSFMAIRQRTSSFLHAAEDVQVAAVSLSICDEGSQFEDEILVSSVFAESEIERSRMSHERDQNFLGLSASRNLSAGGVQLTDTFSAASTAADASSMTAHDSSTKGKLGKQQKRGGTTIKLKKLDLISMLDRCGGDLQLLNGVLDRFIFDQSKYKEIFSDQVLYTVFSSKAA